MSSLAFVDVAEREYEEQINRLYEESILSINESGKLHPEVQKMLDSNVSGGGYHESHSGNKRSREDMCIGNENKQVKIDLERYNVDENSSLEMLMINEAYLRHQELVLKELLPKTIMNQWVMNNEFVKNNDIYLQDAMNRQIKQIVDLNKHRERIQLESDSTSKELEKQWHNQLIKNIQ